MAYARLQTRNNAGLHPNLRGIAPMYTGSSAGLRPEFRGMGDDSQPLTTFSIGPGGQYSFGIASTPTPVSLGDQMMSWLSGSSFLPGVPNSVVAIGAGLFGLFLIAGGRRRR
jgi:MYXO-CTERM domain-containing protein